MLVFLLVDIPTFSTYTSVPIGRQVLCDPVLRQRYDENGKGGVDKEEFMDTKAFFEMSFGSEAFEHLVGVLVCARLYDQSRWSVSSIPAVTLYSHICSFYSLGVYFTSL